MKETKKETKHEKMQQFLIRKQNYVYGTLIAFGVLLMIRVVHFDVGVAFLTVGCVGLLMSWTSMNIGDSIKEEIHKVGNNLGNKIDGLGNKIDGNTKVLAQIRDILKEKEQTG